MKKLGKRIVGGTQMPEVRTPCTVILDLTHQGSEIYIDTEGGIEVNGDAVDGFDSFKKAIAALNEGTTDTINEERLTGLYDVTALAFDRKTGVALGKAPRVETVDVDNNKLFNKCNSILDLHDAYERYWNDMDPNTRGIVFVHKIEKSKELKENFTGVNESTDNEDAIAHAAKSATFPVQPVSKAQQLQKDIINGGPYKTKEEIIEKIKSVLGNPSHPLMVKAIANAERVLNDRFKA